MGNFKSEEQGFQKPMVLCLIHSSSEHLLSAYCVLGIVDFRYENESKQDTY